MDWISTLDCLNQEKKECQICAGEPSGQIIQRTAQQKRITVGVLSINEMSTIVWSWIIYVRAVINNEARTLRELIAQESLPHLPPPPALLGAFNLQTVSFLPVQWECVAGCRNKVPKRRDIKDLRDKAGEMRGAVAGLCLPKIKALQVGRMMDGRESFIHQGLFTSPLNRPTMPRLPLPSLS